MRENRSALTLCAVVSLAVPAGLLAAVPGTETFDIDTAGFVGNTTSSVVVHDAANGNPGGHIQSRKDLSPPVYDIGALTTAADFTGDYAAAGIGKASVDLNFGTDNITGAWLRFRPSVNENGWRYPLTNTFPTDVWNTYSVMFDPTWSDAQALLAGWVTDDMVDPGTDPSLSFASVMASVYAAEARVASPDESTLVGIDNFSIDVPEPASLAFLGLAAGVLASRRSRRPSGAM